MVANKPGAPRRARISRNTIAQGGPGCLGRTCGSAACFFSARGPWERSAPGLPCALCTFGGSRSPDTRTYQRRGIGCACQLFDTFNKVSSGHRRKPACLGARASNHGIAAHDGGITDHLSTHPPSARDRITTSQWPEADSGPIALRTDCRKNRRSEAHSLLAMIGLSRTRQFPVARVLLIPDGIRFHHSTARASHYAGTMTHIVLQQGF